jgi:hypothetical protein
MQVGARCTLARRLRTHVRNLHGRRAQREQLGAPVFCVAVQVHEDLDAVGVNPDGQLRGAHVRRVEEVLHLALDARAVRAAIRVRQRVHEHLRMVWSTHQTMRHFEDAMGDVHVSSHLNASAIHEAKHGAHLCTRRCS